MADEMGKAYMDIRVCNLVLQQGTTPKGLDSGFHIDGLYVVLRCHEEVRRTSCLWPSTYAASAKESRSTSVQQAVGAGAYEEPEEEDMVWNEMFRFVVPSAVPSTAPAATPLSPQSMPSVHGGDSRGGFGAPYTRPLCQSGGNCGAGGESWDIPSGAAPSMFTADGACGFGASYKPPHSSHAISSLSFQSAAAQQQSSGPHNSSRPTEAKATNSPLFYPTIELELWRSTPPCENLLGRYMYHVPMELMQAGYDLSSLDSVVERVVLLHTKEAPSIMGNLYGWSGHRLSLRLRVQAVGLAPLVPAQLPQDGSDTVMMTAANMAGSCVYPVSFSAIMSGAPLAGAPPYTAAGVYGSPLGTLNPVLASLLAPLGVSTGVSAAGNVAPSVTMSMPGGMGGDILHRPPRPPLFSMFPPASGAAAGMGGRALPPHLPGAPSATLQSSAHGILGDGDLAWQSSTTQLTVYPPHGLPQER
ncbi:hypothetical protein CUR178_02610 [Leishmania enriettii]|uniref:Uncharacterized protein n=1 Tax=Leishmania enriettii TaxID=5663 RepID=A0A836GU80_LEIEN|nr:hypothetical protein CUR178_02610 [Leishmania enriettii]